MEFTIISNIIYAIFLINLATPLTGTITQKPDFTTEHSKQILKLSKSADIKNLLNTKIEPCADFYNFACGTWQNINPAQIFGDVITDKFDDLTKGIESRLNSLLQEEKTGNASVEDKMKDFYQSCKNTKTDNIQYRLALENVYKEFGQFSFLKTKEELTKKKFQWWSTIAKIQNIYGKFIILSVDILDDVKNNSRTMLYLGPPEFETTQSAINIMHSIQKTKIREYLKLYFNIETDEATKVAKELIEFEKSLSMGATDVRTGKTIEDLLTLYNTTDLKENYTHLFDVEKFLKIVLGTKDLPEQVYVYDESYLEQLVDVFNSTDDQIVENYILWLLVEEYIVDVRDNEISNICTEKTKIYFGEFIDHVIYNQYRSQEGEAEIYELWDDIKYQFRHDLNSDKYYWISNATREHAIQKLNNMKLTINSYDNGNFEEIFKNLDIDPANYVVNVQNILKHSEALRENKLEKKPEGIDDAQLLSYTPVYNIFENQIKIPIALLQPRHIWDPNYPKAIQYSTLGFLIAHEMIHGFDDEGRNYDANGNARVWWDEKSTYEFESRRKCFQAQYHNYTYAGKRLTESALQSENIADNAGVKLAYFAYLRWLEKQKQADRDVKASETLPRLQYNNRELFFISFAQAWCEDTQSFFKDYFANSDIHAPAKYRVIGSLSNFREFSWIWKCKEDAPMDPSVKCEIY